MTNICGHINSIDFILGNSFFGAFKLTKSTPDFGKYKYFGYGIGFDACRRFSLSNGSGFCKDVIMFGAEMRLSLYVDNRKTS